MQREVAAPKQGIIERVMSDIVWRFIVAIVYVGGLSLLIPAAFLYVFPPELKILAPTTSPTILWTAVIMVLAGFFITLYHTKTIAKAFKSLGRITFIPGMIGLVMSFFGRDLVLLYLAGTVPGFTRIQMMLTAYLDNAVPRVRYLTLSFFVLGIVLWLIGDKLETDNRIARQKGVFRRMR